MAAPESVTTLDFSGKYIMSKTQSDSMDKMLELQGIGWLTRKAVQIALISLSVNHYKDDDGVEHINIDQIATGGLAGSKEPRTLDWTFRERHDPIFGPVIARSRRIKVEDVTVPFLSTGWLPDTVEHGLIEAYAESDTPKSKSTWQVSQLWGFQLIEGDRKYTRLLKFTGPNAEDLELRLVYDYYSAVLTRR